MANKRIIGREDAVEALAGLCRDYRGTALRAIRQGGEEVYIPANVTYPDEMLEALKNPQGMTEFESQKNYEHKEPCYASLIEFLSGRNADGTTHSGFILVDVVAKLVVDLRDRQGRSVVPATKNIPCSDYSFTASLASDMLQGRTRKSGSNCL